jgi:dCTP diphosphatase
VTTVQALQDQIRAFVDERDWSRFHAPRNLAAAISVEAAELLDIFKWSSGRESVGKHVAQIRDEVADVMIYCLSLCNQVGIDAADAIQAKVAKNAEKYPVAKYKGRWR